MNIPSISPNLADPDRHRRLSESGFGLVEIMMALVIVSVGLMGFVSAISSAQLLARGTKEVNLAHVVILSEAEEFHDACAADFRAAMAAHEAGTFKTIASLPIGKNVQLFGTLILDETALSPPIDLNGDDDFVDTAVPIADLEVAVLHLEIRWAGATGIQEIHYYSVICRGEVR